MQRTDKYFKKELFQGFISEGQFLYSYGVFIHSCVCFLFHSRDHCLLTSIIYLSVFFAGSNLLLQRIMVKRGVPEDMTFVAFDSTTSLCTSSYVRICITLSFCIVVFLFREKKFSILLLLPHRKCLASQRGELVCNKFMRWDWIVRFIQLRSRLPLGNRTSCRQGEF